MPAEILHLAHRFPFPPDKGDRIRTYHTLRFLAKRARVHLACLADEPVAPEALAELHKHCARVAFVPLGPGRWLRALSSLLRGGTITEGAFTSPGLRQIIASWAREQRFDAVLASASSMVPYLALEELRDVPAVVDLVDVDSQKWLDYAARASGPRAWLFKTEARRLRRLEAQLPARLHAVTLVSNAEAQLYRQFCLPGTVAAIPNGVDLNYFHPEITDEETSCVFVGALDYPPNVAAAVWFCREVWPGLRQRLPQAKFVLVGRRPAPAVQRLARLPGVEVVGGVPDVRPYVRRSAVVVAPLRLARGLQNKVLEALALGKAVVAAPAALAALRVEVGTHLLSASAPAEWQAAVSQLLDDPSLRQRVGAAGRKFVEEHHAWDRCLEPFARLLLDPTANKTETSLAGAPGLDAQDAAGGR